MRTLSPASSSVVGEGPARRCRLCLVEGKRRAHLAQLQLVVLEYQHGCLAADQLFDVPYQRLGYLRDPTGGSQVTAKLEEHSRVRVTHPCKAGLSARLGRQRAGDQTGAQKAGEGQNILYVRDRQRIEGRDEDEVKRKHT